MRGVWLKEPRVIHHLLLLLTLRLDYILKPKPGVALSSQGCQLVLIITCHGVDRAEQVWSAAEMLK
jgi:hypothetical protein